MVTGDRFERRGLIYQTQKMNRLWLGLINQAPTKNEGHASCIHATIHKSIARGRPCSSVAKSLSTLLKLLTLLLLMVFPGTVFPKYHPAIHWKEISNKQFIVVFPAGYREEAAFTLDTAQQLHDRLTQLWGPWIQVHGKIRILLTDSYDDSNGSATFFPYNQIEIYWFTPPPDSAIGSGRDWIRMVLSHELTHIIHFNAGSGFIYFLRKILGANPLLFPAIYMPEWVMEGLAVYAESETDPGGRLNTPDYELMLDHIAKADALPGWRNISGDPTPWPGSISKYLYGSAFVDFLVKKYGSRALNRLVRTYAYYPIPLTVTKELNPKIFTFPQRFRQVFGKKISKLWSEFIQQVKLESQKIMTNPGDDGNGSDRVDPGKEGKEGKEMDDGNHGGDGTDGNDMDGGGEGTHGGDRNVGYPQNHAAAGNDDPPMTNGVTWLTRQGKFKKYPVLIPGGKIFYVNQDFKEYPGIYLLDIKTGKSQCLIKKSGINSLYYSEPGNTLYFSAADYFKTFYHYSDIYRLDLKTHRVKQLTKGERLFYPVKASAGDDKIYCVKRVKGQSYLAVLDLKTRRTKILSGGFDSLAYIAVSPDNRCIAASLKRKNQEWAIALFNLEGRLETVLTEGMEKCYYPQWKDTGELFFICRVGNSYRLASVHLEKKLFSFYDDPGIPALWFFSLQPGEEGEKIAASFFDANGYNLGLMNLPGVKKRTQSLESTTPPLEHQMGYRAGETRADPPQTNKIKPYNSIRELVPAYIDGDYRYGGEEFQPGVLLSGHDLTSRNSYGLEAFYGFKSRTANFIFTYTYDGLYPTLSLRYSDLSDYNYSPDSPGYFIRRERKVELMALCPLRVRARHQAYLYSDIHFDTSGDPFLNSARENQIQLNGMKLGIFYNSAKRYYDSISAADGISLSLSYAREFRFMGSDYDIGTAAMQYKHYISLGRPNVLAFRFGIMDSWGQVSRRFYMGGSKSKIGFHTAGNDLFDLMRGYPAGYFAGTGGYLVNIEYRVSLFKIEKAFLISRSIQRLYMSFFADIGNLWMGKWRVNPAYSPGMELNLLFFLGDLKLNASAGIALGLNPYHSPVVYCRLGNSF